MMMSLAPSMRAQAAAIKPTGPAPKIASVEPSLTSGAVESDAFEVVELPEVAEKLEQPRTKRDAFDRPLTVDREHAEGVALFIFDDQEAPIRQLLDARRLVKAVQRSKAVHGELGHATDCEWLRPTCGNTHDHRAASLRRNAACPTSPPQLASKSSEGEVGSIA